MVVSSTLKPGTSPVEADADSGVCTTVPPVVIGYGNPIRQDDGMGWLAAELLQRALPPHAATIAAEHQLAPELVTTLKQAPLVIFLDAAVDLDPGTIRLQALRPAELQPFSHHILPDQLLGLAVQLNGQTPRAFVISGGVTGLEYSQDLTPAGEACAARMANLARRILTKAFTDASNRLPPALNQT